MSLQSSFKANKPTKENMDQNFAEQLTDSLSEILFEAKEEALKPVVTLIVQEVERAGFTLREFVKVLSDLADDRNLKEETKHLDSIAADLEDESNE